ncbi:hypothetical protein HUW51_19255 [Adhaeribacter swui]|uniref:GNAT family N-acetyltransferase n=1 Tax=Adhaeribacter swui TaxID=2086471 RepID=A0A7G7GC77_9BACT|nr:hypothetical protein [Adhaeribacter swui]QNF34761.1 hypothetical protein HUW51_19255 [Adhaeribacter swui]
MEVLLEKENYTFILDKQFDYKYLAPIGRYVQWKLEHQHWDDYNELYHATRLVENLLRNPEVWIDSHAILKNNAPAGVILMVGGKIKKLEDKYPIINEDQSLLLKYFHIQDKGQGLGSFWLNSIILPYYRALEFKEIYVNSSHPHSFGFYRRIGSLINTYQQPSDNNRYTREGSCFKVNL